jgi:hypothetical protein
MTDDIMHCEKGERADVKNMKRVVIDVGGANHNITLNNCCTSNDQEDTRVL